ncbi:uncharacterized protein LOC116251152 isoform X1 [Nymphaea colorata]|nr:uncharacterized protein LOC116251152 isoform X1 [Nymphaea colorata]XP_049933013.1 uncharacterized protein LOC116251152 isoform X1 [Nymphaea colorata]XP_049933014.1 uncharacterized protein LOC116251152 isoform X1 [Nymphaea colorata]XP_049933015.1 uncharacterized protein LOC116251152 isoform X1 [Nymphaea colorata]
MASLSDAKKLMFKHQSLKQDFDDLFRQTQALRAKLHEAKEKRLRLVAEVRFLWRKHKLLSSNSSQTTQNVNQVESLEAGSGSGRRRRSYKEEEVAASRSHPLLDLNQASEQGVEEEGEPQVPWEPLNKKSKAGVFMADQLANDLKLSICRGIVSGIGNGNEGTERTGKRKISWQDQVALRV